MEGEKTSNIKFYSRIYIVSKILIKISILYVEYCLWPLFIYYLYNTNIVTENVQVN